MPSYCMIVTIMYKYLYVTVYCHLIWNNCNGDISKVRVKNEVSTKYRKSTKYQAKYQAIYGLVVLRTPVER